MKNKKGITKTLASLTVLALALTACSSGTTTESGSGGGSTAAASGGGAAGDIPIGYLAGFTGFIAPFTEENFKTAQMFVEEVNADGGILNNQKLKLISEDNQSKREGSIRGSQKLINNDKVVALVGLESGSMLGLAKEAQNRKVPIFSQYAGTPELDDKGGSFVFRTAASDTLMGKVKAKFLIEKGKTELAIMHENSEDALTEANMFKKLFEEAGGKVSKVVAFNSGQNSYQAELAEVAKANPSLVYFVGGPQTGPIVFKNAFQRNYKWEWTITPDIANQGIIDTTGKELTEGMTTLIPAEDSGSERSKEFIDKFQKKFNFAPGEGMYNTNLYDLLAVVTLAMEAGKEASGQAINDNLVKVANPPGVEVTSVKQGIEELRKGNDINYEGISGPVDFDDHGNITTSYAFMQIRNGKWEQVEFLDAHYINE